jgi:hypothetical protein
MTLLGDSAGTPIVPIKEKKKNGELAALVISFGVPFTY